MFTPEVRKITVTRTELVIPSGATRKDFYDAAWKADQTRGDGDAQKLHDDSWCIEARDEEVVIYWTTEEKQH